MKRSAGMNEAAGLPTENLSLPTFFRSRSIFWNAEPPQCELKHVQALTDEKLKAVIGELSQLRTDNKVFLYRLNACQEFQESSRIKTLPHEAHQSLLVHYILGEPHDRVAIWLLIQAQMVSIMKVSKGSNELEYANNFRYLLCMLKQRYE